MYIFQVHHYIQRELVETYKAATLENATVTHAKEPGVLRFDFFQDANDPTHFTIFEIYRDLEARDSHLRTAHFLKWKDVYLSTQARKGNGEEYIAITPTEQQFLAA